MGSTFADPDFGETVESQLTLGTASLLGIFFGLVMICGIFFGFGYSIGRRNSSAMASATPVSKPLPEVPSASRQVAVPQPPPTAITPSSESLIASVEGASAPAPITLPRLPGAVAAQPSAGATTTIRSNEDTSNFSSTRMAGISHPALLPETLPVKVHIPKPSAFAPVIVVQTAPGTPLQRIVAGPQFTSQAEPSPYFVWTPPFDVHRKRVNGREVAFVNTVHTRATRPSLVSAVHTPSSRPALVLQIAALSRQDDAEVLATSLRKGGFTPSIKSGVEDALYHVEVGPYDREAAVAARQRLIARGYNAILR